MLIRGFLLKYAAGLFILFLIIAGSRFCGLHNLVCAAAGTAPPFAACSRFGKSGELLERGCSQQITKKRSLL